MSIHTITSESRAQLAEAIGARDALTAEQNKLRAAIDRLTAAAAGAEAPERALANLDAQESAAALAWAHESEGTPAPIPDAKKRAELTEALSLARIAATAAKSALPGLEAQLTGAAQQHPSIQAFIGNAACQVIAEQAIDLIADFEESHRVTAAKALRLQIAREELQRMAETGGTSDAMRPAFLAIADLSERLRKAGSPYVDDALAAEHRLGWRRLADNLRIDASAKLESAK
jgi:hypothetical protein